jgi:TPP-dependent pyruvate/acetoin dehydrogenase alpha subunit
VRALEPRDRILTNHRSAGHLIARGADHGRLIAEVLGRAAGYCKGKSGSLHIAAKALGVVLTSSIAGGGLSLAPGVALAQKMGAPDTEAGGIVVVFFGDGAACEGIFHEAVNLAVTWQLPLLFVCENNQWQGCVRRDETMPLEHIAGWVGGHGIETRVIDGNDVEAVHAAAQEMAAAMRADGEPRFLELTTYRARGHLEPDDQDYVEVHELADARARDPIERHAATLLRDRVMTEGELAAMRERVSATLDVALAFAQAAPWPDASQVASDVYA